MREVTGVGKLDEAELRRFGAQVQRLIQGEDLSRQEAHALFRDLLLDRQPELQQGALLAALAAKGETVDEIIGAWRAIDEIDTIHTRGELPGPLVENSGTGMDQLKTFNVSSAAAIVAASLGVKLARHGARALTSRCGTVDILEAVGVDVSCSVTAVERSLREAGIGLFNGMSPQVHPGALGRILSQIRFGSTLNIAASLANPARPTIGLRGVYSPRLVGPVAEVMTAIGYRRGLVVHGTDDASGLGMDEISPCGHTVMRRFDENSSEDLEVTPESVGLDRHPTEAIAFSGSIEQEAERFVQVLAGADHAACVDFTCLNAAGVLLVAGRCSNLAEGIAQARSAVEAGQAVATLRRWVDAQDGAGEGPARLEQLLRRAGIAGA